MNREEIDYWLRYFSNHNHGFMSEDGKKITLFKVFQELKELHYLLEIKNDYINELEKENQRINGELREENKRLYKTIEELSQYEYDREEEDMMNYIIEQEEVFNDYSFMEE